MFALRAVLTYHYFSQERQPSPQERRLPIPSRQNLTFYFLSSVNELMPSSMSCECGGGGGGGGGGVGGVLVREMDSWVSRRGQLLHRGFPQFHCFWKIFKHPISRQLKQKVRMEEGRENNRLKGGDGERGRGRNGLMVGDTALECCSGFNYRQRNSLFKYLESR